LVVAVRVASNQPFCEAVDRGRRGPAGAPGPHRWHQGRELQAKSSCRKGFQRCAWATYVIDAGGMGVTIKTSNHTAQQRPCGDTKTGPPALRLTPIPINLIDTENPGEPQPQQSQAGALPARAAGTPWSFRPLAMRLALAAIGPERAGSGAAAA